MPDLALQGKSDIAPDRAWWRDRERTPAAKTQALVAEAPRIGEPKVWMTKAFSEPLEVAWAGKRDHSHPALQRCDLLVEFPQLREMVLTIESTEVAEENQNSRTAQQLAAVEKVSFNRHEVEVEVDPHRNMMRAPTAQYVIRITARGAR